jgi:hypothetical protein
MKKTFLVLPIAAALTIATGCKTCCSDANKQASTSATPTTTAPAPTTPAPVKSQLPTLRINAGAGTVKDSSGVEWLTESGFTGGDIIERPDLPIANTKQPEIYRSEHYAMESFTQKLPNGKYQVKLHFCETFEGISGPGERVFSFDVEGKTFKDFDVWAKSGGAARAYVETVAVDITDGQLDIKFTAQVENPEINGIEILPHESTTASNQYR